MAASLKKVALKLLIDRQKQRVLFAEAGKDFVDFLFSLLLLPVGTVIRLLGDKRDMVGGMAKLYESVSDLNDDYIQSNQNKDSFLKPTSSLPFSTDPQVLLLPNGVFSSPSSASNSSANRLYACVRCGLFDTVFSNCPICRATMKVDDRYVLKSEVDAKGGGFVKGLVTYVVMDDLAVSPILSPISNITLFNKSDIKDLGALEEKIVDIGMTEGLELLKHSLYSKTVPTDVFIGKDMVTRQKVEKV